MIFVDSDAFLALHIRQDPQRQKALVLTQKLKKQKTRLVTSWEVIDEVTTKLSFYTTKKAALNFLEGIFKSGILVVFTDEDIARQALGFFKRQKSKRVSLTDCTNMAIAKLKKIDTFFSFDKHYLQNNFKLYS
jgi:predicted nucleic acid-binding protein